MKKKRLFKLDKEKSKKFIAVVCLTTLFTLTNFKVSGSTFDESNFFKPYTIQEKVPETLKEKPKESVSKPIYEIEFGLDMEVQKYIYDRCEELNLDFIKTMGLIHHESKFDSTNIGSTNDYGLFQINKMNHNWLSKNLKTPCEPLDPIINSTWGTYMLKNIYTFWEERVIKEEQLDHFVWSTYNKGLKGFKSSGEAVNYINKVYESIDYINETIEHDKKQTTLKELYVMKEELETIKKVKVNEKERKNL